jgi:hypothetical protein
MNTVGDRVEIEIKEQQDLPEGEYQCEAGTCDNAAVVNAVMGLLKDRHGIDRCLCDYHLQNWIDVYRDARL